MRLKLLPVPYVVVVDIDVDEIPERALLAVEMPTQLGVLARYLVQSFAHSPRVNQYLRLVARELSECRRDQNCYCHS